MSFPQGVRCRAPRHLCEQRLPLGEQLASETAHGLNRGRRSAAARASALQTMNGQGLRCRSRIGFDGRNVRLQRRDAGLVLDDLTKGLLDQARIG